MTRQHDEGLQYVEQEWRQPIAHAAFDVEVRYAADRRTPLRAVTRGYCPRCGGEFEDSQLLYELHGFDDHTQDPAVLRDVEDELVDLVADGLLQPVAPGFVLDVLCTCDGAHGERPAGCTGCGANWALLLPTSP